VEKEEIIGAQGTEIQDRLPLGDLPETGGCDIGETDPFLEGEIAEQSVGDLRLLIFGKDAGDPQRTVQQCDTKTVILLCGDGHVLDIPDCSSQ